MNNECLEARIKEMEKQLDEQKKKVSDLEKGLIELKSSISVEIIQVKSEIQKNTEVTTKTHELLEKDGNMKNKLIFVMLLAILLFAGLKITELIGLL